MKKPLLLMLGTLALAMAGVSAANAHPASATSTPATQTQALKPQLTPLQLEAAFKTLEIKTLPGGKIVNACEDAVVPSHHAVELGGEVGRAWLLELPGGANSPTCYGDGNGLVLVRPSGNTFASIWQGVGFLSVLKSQHKGVYDIANGGPGLTHPVLAWNGKEFVNSGTIKDQDMPAPVN